MHSIVIFLEDILMRNSIPTDCNSNRPEEIITAYRLK